MARAVDRGGDSGATFLLLHGLGATRGVWAPLCAVLEDHGASWIAPDLAGHGAAAWTGAYGVADYAAALADLAADADYVLGHSMGGVVALAMASGRHGRRPGVAFALGIKSSWTDDELHRLHARADQPPKLFASEAEARSFHLKVTGLADPALAAHGVVADGSAWRLACDPCTQRIVPPAMDRLVKEAICPIHLAAGAHDLMSNLAQMRRVEPDACLIVGAGHNAMVDAPQAVWSWIAERL